MQKLIRGIRKFQQQVFGEQREFFEKLVDGQTPEALFITCSDSRVSPNLITQTRPGELFISRNAGNLVPAHSEETHGEAATIEYAVSILGVQHIIICGHSNCSAMQALLDPKVVEHLPRVKNWLAHAEATRAIVEKNYSQLEPADRLMATVQENVLVQLAHLRTQPSVATGLAAGTLRLHAWVYKFETGQVFAYDEAQQEFIPLHNIGSDPEGAKSRTMSVI